MINWFPGHMNKTLKQMQSDSRLCDCFIYVLDARCPLSCLNPEFMKVVKGKPIIFILNKADLIAKTDTTKWQNYFKDLGYECLNLNACESGSSAIIIRTIKKIFSEKLTANQNRGVSFITRAMILGVPNSGKSTIVNNLCNKSRAVTGNKAGVTKNKQWVRVEANIEIMDTPGVLLPNFEREDDAYNLAFVGSVKDDVLNIIDVASKLAVKLIEKYPNSLITRYGVDNEQYTHSVEMIEKIGKKRGCMIKGGEVDIERASKILLVDFRAGKLGKICLE